MKTFARLKALQLWIYETICKGREMKTQGKDIADIARIEPQVHIVYDPARVVMQKVTPGILIMVNPGKGKYEEEKRFDRYNAIRRPQSMGQEL